MKNSKAIAITVAVSLSILAVSDSAIADELTSRVEPALAKLLSVPPKGMPPLVGMARALPKDADDSRKYAWSLELSVPKVIWEITGKGRPMFGRPQSEWTKIEQDVQMKTFSVPMGYSGGGPNEPMTALSEGAQNRLVDLDGKRLSREEALKRLSGNAPVLVSITGEMPDPFYLQCSKPDSLIFLFGLPSAEEFNLMPTLRASSRYAEQDGTGQPATRPESKSDGSDNPQPEAEGRSR